MVPQPPHLISWVYNFRGPASKVVRWELGSGDCAAGAGRVGGRAGGLAGELGNGRGFGRGAKPRALPMPPTAQEMASELHAWRRAGARSRSTVKGGTAGLGSPARAVTARCQAPPSVSESRRSWQQGWPGRRSQRHPAGCQTRGSVAAASLAVRPGCKASFAS